MALNLSEECLKKSFINYSEDLISSLVISFCIHYFFHMVFCLLPLTHAVCYRKGTVKYLSTNYFITIIIHLNKVLQNKYHSERNI